MNQSVLIQTTEYLFTLNSETCINSQQGTCIAPKQETRIALDEGTCIYSQRGTCIAAYASRV